MGVIYVATKEVGSLVRGELFETEHCGSLTGFGALEGVDSISVYDSSDVIPTSAATTIERAISENLAKDPHFLLANPHMKFTKGKPVKLLEIAWGNSQIIEVPLEKLLADFKLTAKAFRKLVNEYKDGNILLHKVDGRWADAESVTI